MKYGDAASALAPSDPATSAPEEDDDGEGLEEETPGEAGSSEAAGSAGDTGAATNEGEAPAHTTVNPADPSQLDTLVMEETPWPPRPWIPKSSLRRWSRSRSMCLQDWFKYPLLMVQSFETR